MLNAERKSLGAFYTDKAAAQFIVDWALPRRGRLLDPSCGDGVFLSVASSRQMSRGVGVEISELQSRQTRTLVPAPLIEIITGDFFDYYPTEKFDAVVGNPPFIRYQSFPTTSREKALFRCRLAGVALNKLSSSWAHFVVVASEMLKVGGRLGLVLPAELLHANYAKPVLAYLARSFESVTIVTFKRRLFPDISQDTLILLASGRGASCDRMMHIDAESIDDLRVHGFDTSGTEVSPQEYLRGNRRMKENFIDPKALQLIEGLLESGLAYRLGDKLSSDIGYVTGANEFFHLTSARAKEMRLPNAVLSPAVFRSRGLSGLAFTIEDWKRADENGEAGYLLHITDSRLVRASTRRYLNFGESQGYHERHKCRIRKTWYSVPHVYRPEAFLTSMSGEMPFIVVNDANVVTSNSLHILRSRGNKADFRRVAFSWLSAVSALSVEVEGHALGGGMLKLEPKESERVVLVDLPRLRAKDFNHVDGLLRSGDLQVAGDFVDAIVCDQAGVPKRTLKIVRRAVQELRSRRRKQR